MDKAYVGMLPQGYHPLRYEDAVAKWWAENRVYERVKAQRSGGPKFYFLDGPPFPSSDTPHIGTCWNKVVKDVVIRYQRARGFNVRDQPGYDCHGLPIEIAVEKALGFKTKRDVEKYGVQGFIADCKRLALQNLQAMSAQFRNLGVWMDWDNPYVTLSEDYIESAWWTVKEAYAKGFLSKGLKVLHWCSRCETVLSEYEVMEYHMLRDPSVYVMFPIAGGEKTYIVIWTTTPWTLPSNVAVMVHPDFEYARVRHGDEVYIMAKDRLDTVFTEVGKKYEVLETFPGVKLQGLRYASPLVREVPAQSKVANAHRVVLSREYVTLTEGTGCVHMSPAHGEEDFEVASRNGLPVLTVVDEQGRFTSEAGRYAGKSVRDANVEIIEDLRKAGFLFHSSWVEHRYPVCWRCKTPLLLQATRQWFIKMTAFKERMLTESSLTTWVPEWAGASRFKEWLTGVRDWVISRQRFWGTALPIWVCESCRQEDVIGSFDELKSRAQSMPEGRDLHASWLNNVTLRCRCGGVMRRVPDVLVCWFDSGVASYASLSYPKSLEEKERWWPVDFIVEGHDQIAGWFFSLLKAGVLVFNQSPYRTVLMHGFMLDEKGREMHKSLGNYVAPNDVVEKYGRDALRFYVLQNTVWHDLRFSWKGLDQALSDLNTLWNVYFFASTYMNLDTFNPRRWPLTEMLSHMRPEDLWLLSRTQRLIKNVTEAIEAYSIHEATRMLKEFVLEDLSHNYVRLVRRRTWVEREDPDKLAAYLTLYESLKTCLTLLAPLTPFLAEKIYLDMIKKAEPELPESIHMLDWPTPKEELINDRLERQMAYTQSVLTAISAARMRARLKLRQPVRYVTIVTDDEEVKEAVKQMQRIILEQGNTRGFGVTPTSGEGALKKTYVRPNMAVLGPQFKGLAQAVAEALRRLDGGALRRAFQEMGSYNLRIAEEMVEIKPEHVSFMEEAVEGMVVTEFDKGRVYLDTVLTTEEVADGLARDVVRRIQQMRKELNLPVDAYIIVFVQTPDEEGAGLLETRRGYLAFEVRAETLLILKPQEPRPRAGYVKDWRIKDQAYRMGITAKT